MDRTKQVEALEKLKDQAEQDGDFVLQGVLVTVLGAIYSDNLTGLFAQMTAFSEGEIKRLAPLISDKWIPDSLDV